MIMHTVVRSIVAIALVAIAIGCAPEQSADAPAEQSTTREVVLYYSADDYVARPVIDAFETETGIQVRALGDTEATKTTGLVQRLRQEHTQGTPRADVFWSSEVFMTALLADEGVLAPVSIDALEGWPERWRDGDDRWFGFGIRGRVVVFNTNLIAESSAPEQLIDLLDPRFRDRVVIARPEFGTTRGHFAALLNLWGESAYRQWLQDLKRNGVKLVDGNAAVVQAVATGEAIVGLTDTDDVYSGQRNDWPIAMKLAQHAFTSGASFSMIDMTLAGPLLIPNTAARVAGGPNEAEALELIEFLLSPEVERILAESDSHNTPVHPGVRASYPEYALPLTNIYDRFNPYADMATDMNRAIEIAHEILTP